MTSENIHYRELVRLLLPSELFDYFELTSLVVEGKNIHVYLEEQDLKPEVFQSEKLLSKGFHPEIVIHDFPIRDKAVLLHIRRRRWLVERTGELVSRDWDSVAEGTRYTKSFADFLKGLFGQIPNQQRTDIFRNERKIDRKIKFE